MEVILLEDITGLGKTGETVKVAPGYARNYLLPREIAIAAAGNSANLFRELQKRKENRNNKLRRGSEELARKLEALAITIPARAGDDDTLFGSVTSMDIAAKVNAEGIELDRRKLQLDEPLKALGVFKVPVKLPGNVTAELRVWVVRESETA
ncbi:MAG: 50S ribosomal protein L9 [Candidatus Eisenbacteria bacterium]|nr:50S ribosomal protein L9 [Candidatus Eisenbacteria bacterium]